LTAFVMVVQLPVCRYINC